MGSAAPRTSPSPRHGKKGEGVLKPHLQLRPSPGARCPALARAVRKRQGKKKKRQKSLAASQRQTGSSRSRLTSELPPPQSSHSPPGCCCRCCCRRPGAATTANAAATTTAAAATATARPGRPLTSPRPAPCARHLAPPQTPPLEAASSAFSLPGHFVSPRPPASGTRRPAGLRRLPGKGVLWARKRG